MPRCEKHDITSNYKCVKCTVEKRQATMIERYGVASALHSPAIMEKKNKTCMEIYGDINPALNKEIMEKTKKSNLEKYGVEHTLQVKEIREKGNATMMERYGVNHAIQSNTIKEKRVETNRERFGADSALQNPDILQKRKDTNMERYGTDEVLKMHSVQEQIKNTMTDKYGAANPLQCPSIKKKRDDTCEEKYGDKDIMHNADIFEKVAKSAYKRREFTLPSGTIIKLQGYEDVAMRVLLETYTETDIITDIKLMPKFMYEFEGKNHRYYPDIYIPSEKRIIEVKSTYTYKKYEEKNKCKQKQVIDDGYIFHFWICSDKKILEIF
jgi:hypothetical protein